MGCSLAGLVYARMINEPDDFDDSVVIRDAYLFAAPIVCDVESANGAPMPKIFCDCRMVDAVSCPSVQ